MLISLFMTDRSQAMQLSYFIIIVGSEMHVQLESSAHFIEIHPILTILFNNKNKNKNKNNFISEINDFSRKNINF